MPALRCVAYTHNWVCSVCVCVCVYVFVERCIFQKQKYLFTLLNNALARFILPFCPLTLTLLLLLYVHVLICSLWLSTTLNSSAIAFVVVVCIFITSLLQPQSIAVRFVIVIVVKLLPHFCYFSVGRADCFTGLLGCWVAGFSTFLLLDIYYVLLASKQVLLIQKQQQQQTSILITIALTPISIVVIGIVCCFTRCIVVPSHWGFKKNSASSPVPAYFSSFELSLFLLFIHFSIL